MARCGASRLAAAITGARVGAILLAAGASLRMGAANKLLLPIGGVPMVARVAAAIGEAGLPMLVVLGWEADAVREALTFPPPAGGRVEGVRFVEAADWADGMGASLATGARAIPADWTGVVVCLGDMPFVQPALLARLAAALDRPDAVAVPVHDGQRGNPVGWGRAWFGQLTALSGDTGARALLADAAVTTIAADAGVLRDLDTPLEWEGAEPA